MDSLFQDLKYGWRILWKTPAFTLVAAMVIALGIGSTTAILSIVDAALLRPLPFADPDGLFVVWEDASHMGFPQNSPAPANFSDWKKRNRVFADMAALAPRTFNLTGEGDPETVLGYAAGWNAFPLAGVKPVLGRTFLPEEDRPGGPAVALLSHGLWKRRFGGDAGIVGRAIPIDGRKHVVIGVMPPGLHFPSRGGDVWVPLAFSEQQWARRGSHFLFVMARLLPGVDLAQARADMSGIAEQLAIEYPKNNSGMGARVLPIREQIVAEGRRGLVILLAGAGCVLLIACANIANMLLARTAGRQREIAVRTALGAGRARIARQLVAESLLLAAIGGVAGVVLASWSFDVLKQLVPTDLPLAAPLHLDLRVLRLSLLTTVLTGLLFGIAPVLLATRRNVNEGLKAGGAKAGFGERGRLRNSLVVSEVALALVLLISAVLLLRSFANLRGLDPGFQPEGVLTLRLVLPQSKYPDAAKRAAFFEQAVGKLRSLPGTKGVAFTSALPLVWKGGSSSFAVEGRPEPTGSLPYDANNRVVSPDYMRVMGMKLLAGRFFHDTDGPRSEQVAIVNETMARLYFPGESALGKRIKLGEYFSAGPWLSIVGVSQDVKQMGLLVPPRPEMYFPHRQAFGNWMVPRDLIVRADNPLGLAAGARERIWEIDRDQPVSYIATLDDILDSEVESRRLQVLLIGGFSAMALVLASVGLYGVLSFLVSQRTQEIGVRMALGAQPRDILSSVAGKGLALTVIGIAIGLGSGIAVTRLLESVLFGVSAQDPLTFFAVSAVLLLVASAACFIPAVRAMRVDPVTALRHE